MPFVPLPINYKNLDYEIETCELRWCQMRARVDQL